MRTVHVLSDAVDEAEAATQWYERERPGLGRDFALAVDAALDLLACEPVPASAMPGAAGLRGVRRIILKRFPYDAVFFEDGDQVWVIAFSHHSRRPAFWKDRLGKAPERP
jgi:toxin ParE1/3/4